MKKFDLDIYEGLGDIMIMPNLLFSNNNNNNCLMKHVISKIFSKILFLDPMLKFLSKKYQLLLHLKIFVYILFYYLNYALAINFSSGYYFISSLS